MAEPIGFTLGISYPVTQSEVTKLNKVLFDLQMAVRRLNSSVDGIGESSTESMFMATATGVVGNTDVETTAIGSGEGSLTLPANFFDEGVSLRISASGHVDFTSSVFTLKIKKGSTVILATSGNSFGSTLTNRLWFIDTVITGRSTTSVMAQSVFRHRQSSGTQGDPYWQDMINTSPVAISADSEAINMTVEWGTASTSNIFNCTNFMMEKVSISI